MSLPIINEIDFRTIPINMPSLCIPRVFTNINEHQIRKIFDDLELGIIERIDIVSKYSQSGEKYNRVFIHFKRWFNEQKTVRQRLLTGNDIKIIYDEPWFWKVSAYRETSSINKKTDRQDIPLPTPPQFKNYSDLNDTRPNLKGRRLNFEDNECEDNITIPKMPIPILPSPRQDRPRMKQESLISIDKKLVPPQVTKIYKKQKEIIERAKKDT